MLQINAEAWRSFLTLQEHQLGKQYPPQMHWAAAGGSSRVIFISRVFPVVIELKKFKFTPEGFLIHNWPFGEIGLFPKAETEIWTSASNMDENFLV